MGIKMGTPVGNADPGTDPGSVPSETLIRRSIAAADIYGTAVSPFPLKR